jgi:hypothetical protein
MKVKLRLTTPALLVLAAGVGYIAVNFTVASRLRAQARAAAVPFELKIDIYHYQHGSTIGELSGTQTVARNSAGAVMKQFNNVRVLTGPHRRLNQPDGTVIEIFDPLRMKTTTLTKNPTTTRESSAVSTCIGNPSNERRLLREEWVSGQRTEVTEYKTVSVRVTSWDAPALGCTHLQYRTEQLGDDGLFALETEARLVSLVMADPNPDMFDTRNTYEEVMPSEYEFRGMQWRRIPKSALDSHQLKSIEQKDKAYVLARPSH